MEPPKDLYSPKIAGTVYFYRHETIPKNSYAWIQVADENEGAAITLNTPTDRKACARWLREAAEFLEDCDDEREV